VPHHQQETVHQQFGVICGKVDFSITSHHPISDMVNTRSSHPLRPPPSTPEVSNNPQLRDFLKNMVESMEILRKQNEELNTRLTAAEARSSQKERECVEKREKERRDRVHRGKRPVNPCQEDNESTIQGENEENRDKSCLVETENGGSWKDRSRRERSPREESHRERCEERSRQKRREGEGSHRSRQHRDKSHQGESRHSIHDAKMKDLEDKYSRILQRINGEDPELMAWDMLKDENLPFT
jgi:hypothetical protein